MSGTKRKALEEINPYLNKSSKLKYAELNFSNYNIKMPKMIGHLFEDSLSDLVFWSYTLDEFQWTSTGFSYTNKNSKQPTIFHISLIWNNSEEDVEESQTHLIEGLIEHAGIALKHIKNVVILYPDSDFENPMEKICLNVNNEKLLERLKSYRKDISLSSFSINDKGIEHLNDISKHLKKERNNETSGEPLEDPLTLNYVVRNCCVREAKFTHVFGKKPKTT